MPRSPWLLAALVLAAAVRAVPDAVAGCIADPARSNVDRVLAMCPEGDMVFRMVLIGFSGYPVRPCNHNAVIQFGSCPTFPGCPDLSTNPPPYTIDTSNRIISMTTDPQGVAEFHIRMGGSCPDTVAIYGAGVLLAYRVVVSPDQNGDGVVDATDLALLQANLGHADPTGDFDGDGVVTAADVAVLKAHMGHACPLVTPVIPTTWGRLKLLYR